MQFDAAYHPVVHGDTLLLTSSRTDSVTALDARTGLEMWRFTTDGPVRFAPVVWREWAYFVSDDGYLYCLNVADGTLHWKFRGGASDRKVLGNERLISMWPARGAPAVADGTVYFAAGIWPFMGTFIHALDAQTGKVVWTNDGDGSIFIEQPHHADAFGGVAPQGTLVVAGDRLLVPGGRSVPACFDRKTGKMLHYRLADNSKLGGGSRVSAAGGFFLNGGALFDLETGDYLASAGELAVLTEDAIYDCTPTEVQVLDLKAARREEGTGRRGGRSSWSSLSIPKLGAVKVARATAMAVGGHRLFIGQAGRVLALDLPEHGSSFAVRWQAPLRGTPQEIVAAKDRLIVSTREGRVYCFAPGDAEVQRYTTEPEPVPETDEWTERARDILERTGVRDGYALVWGAGNSRLIAELARQSRLHVVVVDGDRARVDALRADLHGSDLHGDRVSVLAADWRTLLLPPYLASLMVVEELPEDAAFLRRAYASLRPYGGVACISVPAAERTGLRTRVARDGDLPRAKVTEAGEWMLLAREGALPGAGDWTHENADAANSRVSRDTIVKAPLGVLWFGGPGNDGILPRHGHGPQPQVIDGRAIVEGIDKLRAIDIYTGRLLWEVSLPGVGEPFNNMSHQAGANASGGNYVSTADGIYILHGRSCLRLDPATGQRLGEFAMPLFPGESEPPAWTYINVAGDFLIGGANPHAPESRDRDRVPSSSRRLAVMDRYSGKLLWSTMARIAFRNNAICIGGGRLYAIDRSSLSSSSWRRPLGEMLSDKPHLTAFDLASGKPQWTSADDIFGTWLSYSVEYDVLVEAGRVARDSLYDEPAGMRAYDAKRGAALWHHRDCVGPAMIRGDTILTGQGACDLGTGAPSMRRDPLTGEFVPWAWARGYGCNTPAASQHLLTFRSGAAGYYDLCNDGGTGNFGGFRSSCTNNLIVAGGVLVAPEYTRTCTCSYQNQTSLALVPMPEVETWAFFGRSDAKDAVRRVGINLGAPGSRKADDGTLWLEYPASGGPSPRLPITTLPEKVDWFRRHSSQVAGDDLKWVGASGARGLRSLTVSLAKDAIPERACTVRLHFLEPDDRLPGERRFDVSLQGKPVLRGFDVSREAGGSRRMIVKEFRGVMVGKDLAVTLAPSRPGAANEPVLSGIEIVAVEP